MATTVERVGTPGWAAAALAGTGMVFLAPAVGSGPSHRIAAVAALLAAVSGGWWAGESRSRRALLGAAAAAAIAAVVAPGLWFLVPAAVLTVAAALVWVYRRLAGRVLSAGVLAGAGVALLAHGVAVLIEAPGRVAAVWLAAGAALLGLGLSLLDGIDSARGLVGAFGGAAGLLAAGVTALVVGIVILVKGGDDAALQGSTAIGCAAAALVMAAATLYAESEEVTDRLIGWIVGGNLGIGVGLIVGGFYGGLTGNPETWWLLLPGLGFFLPPLPLLDDMFM